MGRSFILEVIMNKQDMKPLAALDEALRQALGSDYHEDDAGAIIAELRELGFEIVEEVA